MTVKKIAELAGVSVGTVDRALNNRPGVNKEVAERINQIAASVGYVPNPVAKGLVARRKDLKFGVVICTPKHYFIEELLRGIEHARESVKDYGVKVFVRRGEDYSVESQLSMVDELVGLGVQGLILIPLNDKRVEAKIEELRRRGIFVVLAVSDIQGTGSTYVGCDLYRSGKVLGGLAAMLSRPGAKLLYCTAPLKILGNKKRFDGLAAALDGYGGRLELAGMCELKNDDLEAYRVLSQTLVAYPDVDVIILATGCTQGVLRAIGEAAFEREAAIIALDLSPAVVAALRERKVRAVVDQHPFLQGKMAMDALSDYVIMGQKLPRAKQYIDTDVKIHENLF